MKADTRRYSILITDDDRGVREALSEIVEDQGFKPVLASDGDEALAIVQSEPIHLALFDLQMPKMSGVEAFQLIHQINALLPAILITADATLEVMRRAFDAHFFSVVPKPVNANVVKATVFRALVRVYGPVEQPSQTPDSGETIR